MPPFKTVRVQRAPAQANISSEKPAKLFTQSKVTKKKKEFSGEEKQQNGPNTDNGRPEGNFAVEGIRELEGNSEGGNKEKVE